MAKLSLHGLEAASSCFDSSLESVYSPRELEEYGRSKCALVLDLLKFVDILVNHHCDKPSSVCVF